ncbi:hypothetical protein ACEPPN_019039 [Leptodophora sp. 'Broadleaf-Isolate-01']
MGLFVSPDWVPALPTPPDSISVEQFMLDEQYGRIPFADSRDPFTCGISGKTYSNDQVKERSILLARALSRELGWKAGSGSEYDKVMGVFALNTIDTMTVAYAVHKLDGVVTPSNAAYSAIELQYQLKDAGATALFTCIALLEIALDACKAVGIPKERVYILEMPAAPTGARKKVPFKTVDDFIAEGKNLPAIEPLKWRKGQGGTQTAFLCYSSGTSGLAIATYGIDNRIERGQNGKPAVDVVLGLLPQSHIYGLVVISFAAVWHGDQVIILPKFELELCLRSIEKYRISMLFLVPPIIIQLVTSEAKCKKYDLSCVRRIFTGAAPLGAETAESLQKQYPEWKICQAYGLTETCAVVSSSNEKDIWFGSSGSLLPGMRCKLISIDGTEIEAFDQPGELVIQSHSVVLGYLNNDKASTETFLPDMDGHGRWMRTGDEAKFNKAPSANVHLTITDRIKELIKVQGMQVAPAELEAHILEHPSVDDCCVIAIPHERSGETPKAFVVKSKNVGLEENDRLIARDICKFVEKHKARHKWLGGGVEFVDVIPKSPSGKILRRLLRDQDKAKRKEGAKL